PAFAQAHHNLGRLLQRRGRTDEAIRALGQALRLTPGDPALHGCLGEAFLDCRRTADALACYQRAVTLRPDDPEGHNGRGNATSALGRLDEAIACYTEALRLRPDWSVPRYNLGVALQGQGKLAQARACFEEAMRLNPSDHVAHSTYAGAQHYDPEVLSERLLSAHRAWAECHAPVPTEPLQHANTPEPERRLKVGYVSPDFRNHAVAFFLVPVLAQHD